MALKAIPLMHARTAVRMPVVHKEGVDVGRCVAVEKNGKLKFGLKQFFQEGVL